MDWRAKRCIVCEHYAPAHKMIPLRLQGRFIFGYVHRKCSKKLEEHPNLAVSNALR